MRTWGGFVLDFTEVLNQQSADLSRLVDELDYELIDGRINSRRMRHKVWALTAPQIEYAHRCGLFETLPQVSGSSLKRLNKGDALVKTLALIQISWLIIQLIVRRSAKLPSSQLEIAALAFSVSSMITYLLYWNRPQGVETIYPMKASKVPTIPEMRGIVEHGPSYIWTWKRGEIRVDSDYDLVPLPNDGYVTFSGGGAGLAFGTIIGGTVFGALHCLAWTFHFPTPVDALLWKICCIMTTALPIVTALILWLVEDHFDIVDGVFQFYLLLPYLIARLIIVVETFRSLFYLAPEAFIDTWSGSLPYWG